ncbi:hypothetical protein A3767_15250 [Oleiphilus sp. HI0133]|nr:hypothetical protein A3767_15250 [Oleiphilus sp. HI0133]
MNHIAVVLTSVSLSTPLSAIEFSHLNGTASSGYNRLGTPTNVQDQSASLPVDVLNNIYSMLPESQYVNASFIDTNLKSNIIIDDDFAGVVTVDVTFLNEGAGYRNAFGYFLFDPNNPPATYSDIAEHVLVFPNASKPPQGELVQGHTVPLNISLTAGQGLGFFVVPNGWSYSGSDGNVSGLGPWGQPFYSLPYLNPEPSALQAHNVAFYDAVNDFFVFGFDDQHRAGGDNDFNDLLVSIAATPTYAVEGINVDGSVDTGTYQVLEQSNEEITSTTYYPSQSGMATLMFEDLWPRMGDYDFNDLVIDYRFTNTLDNRNKLLSIDLEFSIQAIGASYHNGFALRLPGVDPSNIASSSLHLDGVLVAADILEAGQSDANLILLDDAKNHIGKACKFFRTENTCQAKPSGTFVASVEFIKPVDTASIGPAPYDPYIFAVEGKYHGDYDGRGWEVHLKEHAGSDLFSSNLVGLEDDRSNASNSFVNANSFPWALNIPAGWEHPKENIDIVRAYPNFSKWVRSNGSTHKDWYQSNHAQHDHLFGRP